MFRCPERTPSQEVQQRVQQGSSSWIALVFKSDEVNARDRFAEAARGSRLLALHSPMYCRWQAAALKTALPMRTRDITNI